MKIIQITDLHVAPEGEYTHGVDVRKNFTGILAAAQSFAPDLLVLSGDLSYDVPDSKVYQWMKSHLDQTGMFYTLIAGNHDDSALLAGVFSMEDVLHDGEMYFTRQLGDHCIIFLETSAGIMSGTQLDWLKKELSQIQKDVVIFMHHPPLWGGVLHLDLHYPLRNMAEVQPIFFDFPHHVTVFCGHYHAEKSLSVKNLTVHITPSTYFQINWKLEEFQVDHLRMALREIILRNDGVVESTVVYYDGNKV